MWQNLCGWGIACVLTWAAYRYLAHLETNRRD